MAARQRGKDLSHDGSSVISDPSGAILRANSAAPPYALRPSHYEPTVTCSFTCSNMAPAPLPIPEQRMTAGEVRAMDQLPGEVPIQLPHARPAIQYPPSCEHRTDIGERLLAPEWPASEWWQPGQRCASEGVAAPCFFYTPCCHTQLPQLHIRLQPTDPPCRAARRGRVKSTRRVCCPPAGNARAVGGPHGRARMARAGTRGVDDWRPVEPQ